MEQKQTTILYTIIIHSINNKLVAMQVIFLQKNQSLTMV